MLVVMRRGATERQISDVVETIEALGFEARAILGAARTAELVQRTRVVAQAIGRPVAEPLPTHVEA